MSANETKFSGASNDSLDYNNLGRLKKERGYKKFDHRVQPLLYFMKEDRKRSLSPADLILGESVGLSQSN